MSGLSRSDPSDPRGLVPHPLVPAEALRQLGLNPNLAPAILMRFDDRAALESERPPQLDDLAANGEHDAAFGYAIDGLHEHFGDRYNGGIKEAAEWHRRWRSMDEDLVRLPPELVEAMEEAQTIADPLRKALRTDLIRAREMNAAGDAIKADTAKRTEALRTPLHGPHGNQVSGVRSAIQSLERTSPIPAETAKEWKGQRDARHMKPTPDQQAMLHRWEFERLVPEYAVAALTDTRIGEGLAVRAQELQAMFKDDYQMRNRTIAIGQLVRLDEANEVQEAKLLAACSSDNWLRDGRQERAATQMGIVVTRDTAPREHAEASILRHAGENGFEVRAIGVSRPVCPPCVEEIEQSLDGASIGRATQGLRLRDLPAEAKLREQLAEQMRTARRDTDAEDNMNTIGRSSDRGVER